MLLVGSTLAYGGMIWTLSQMTVGWLNARQVCLNQGGDLVKPLDQSASIALGQWLANQSVVASWIGLKEDNAIWPPRKDMWYWVGTAIQYGAPTLPGQNPAYDGWSTGEPDNDGGTASCAQVYGNVPAPAVGRWNDADCSSYAQYVCQFAIGAVPCSFRVERGICASRDPICLAMHSQACVVHIVCHIGSS